MEKYGHQGRLEDDRMLRGAGRYVADWALPNQAWGCFVRSDRAHAEIVAIDASAALDMPGVLAVITGDDLAKAGLKPIPAAAPFKWQDGSEQRQALRPSLAQGRVRHVGELVALVVAETAVQAEDAAEAVMVDYNELRVVGTSDSAPHHVQKAVQLLATGEVPADKLATHVLPLDEIQQAYELMESGQALRVVLRP